MKTTRLKTPQEERNRENEKTFARKQNRRTAKELQTYRCFQKPFPMPRYAMISLKVLEQIVPVEEMPVAKTASSTMSLPPEAESYWEIMPLTTNLWGLANTLQAWVSSLPSCGH